MHALRVVTFMWPSSRLCPTWQALGKHGVFRSSAGVAMGLNTRIQNGVFSDQLGSPCSTVRPNRRALSVPDSDKTCTSLRKRVSSARRSENRAWTGDRRKWICSRRLLVVKPQRATHACVSLRLQALESVRIQAPVDARSWRPSYPRSP